MNYASLYNMRSCFTVKRGGDPRDPWHRLRRLCRCGVARGGHRRRGGYSAIDREGNISRINFAIGEFYVRAASIYYERVVAATRTSIPSSPAVWFSGLLGCSWWNWRFLLLVRGILGAVSGNSSSIVMSRAILSEFHARIYVRWVWFNEAARYFSCRERQQYSGIY